MKFKIPDTSLVKSLPQFDGAFVYRFDSGYESNSITSERKAIHLIAHVASKSWATEAHMKALAKLLAHDFDSWS